MASTEVVDFCMKNSQLMEDYFYHHRSIKDLRFSDDDCVGEFKGPLVLRDLELDARVSKFESAFDYSNEKQETFDALARIGRSRAALVGCVRLDDYQRLNGISRGSYGAVYRARHRSTGDIVAVKEQLNGMSVPAWREIDILRSLRHHPNVVQLKEVAAEDADGVYLVMEHADHDLRRYMEAKEVLSAAEAKHLTRQLMEGLRFLHENMVMHRDLKPSNLLVNGGGELKICDFGLSRRRDAASGLYTPHVGTGWYRAPELEMGVKDYTAAVDMWAAGCVMAEMLLRCGGDTEAGQRLPKICKMVEGGEEGGYDLLRSEFFPAAVVSWAGFDLLSRLLSWDPSKRITAESAVTHAWFAEDSELAF